MKVVLASLLLLFFLSFSEGTLTNEEKTTLLELHNAGRRAVSPTAANMKKIAWDDTIAASAQAYADTCPSYHSSTDYGENLAWGWPYRTAENSMLGWYDEEKVLYNFVANNCSGVCGHYTQVAWANTDRVGCGKKTCSVFTRFADYGAGDVYVCQYSPAGNVNGARPYISGTPCSQCPSGFPYCDDGLCSSEASVCSSSPCANGVCTPTGTGTTFTCDCTNTGFFGPTCSYRLTCPAVADDQNASWQSAQFGTYSWGVCKPGFLGKPYRTCQSNGSFGPVSSPCTPTTATCSSSSYANAQFAPTPINTSITGTCNAGFVGAPLRKCKVDATWEDLIRGEVCKLKSCSSETSGGITWPETKAGGFVRGLSCGSGLVGNPSRACSSLGVWEDVVNPCVASSTCSGDFYARATWPITPYGETATGTCQAGWTGSPLRICTFNGEWQTLVRNHCTRI